MVSHLAENWYEVRALTSWNWWVMVAGPFGKEEEAHDYIDGLTMPGRTVAIVRCGIWARCTL